MRNWLPGLAILLLPAALPAQGRIIVPCLPPPCDGRVCPPPRPCPRPIDGARIERTSTTVTASLENGVLHYEVDERFVNRGGRVGEADYLFPLPSGAAFQDLKLSIDGQMIAGEILGADEARRIYEEIVRRDRDPALVEWMGRGLLRTRIFPIQPGEERCVIVRFQAVAKREGDALRIDYFQGSAPERGPVPMPMPMPRPRGDQPADRGTDREMNERAGGSAARVAFTLFFPDDARYGRPYSPTHSLEIDRDRGRQRVRVRGDAREVTILLPVRRATAASITVLPHAPTRDPGFALITLTPPEARRRAAPRDVTFVLDVSGSMSGTKMNQAREAGHRLLATLEPHDRFRLIDFASDVRTFRDEWTAATPANLREAERYLESLRAEGGTNIAGALEEALRGNGVRSANRLPLVLFITDGEPTVGERDPSRIAALAARLRGDARVFTFGLGADVKVALIEQLALEGRGTAHFVRPEEHVERVVGLVASRLTAPVATDIRVRAEGVRLVQTHPAEALDLFAGQDLVVLTRYEGSGSGRITIEGRGADGPVRWSVPVSWPARERENSFVARLWATQRVGWLSAERRTHGPSRELDDEIRSLGERYGIPTELTSYFVREPGMVVQRDAAGQMRLQEIVVTGANAATPPPAASEAERRRREFDAGRAASVQRSAASIAAVDSMVTIAEAEVARVGGVGSRAGIGGAMGAVSPRRTMDGRTFELRDSVWTDVSWREGMRTIAIAPYSAAYFAVLEMYPELRSAFALGERVVVAGRSIAIRVEAGGAERLSAGERSALQREW
ncbi:MAG TPA: VIT domain-containing protein [Gemmatimonadaceae bacterium]|nr:VIT domain-containing protein [Gemmatimonadaceae bacterium]